MFHGWDGATPESAKHRRTSRWTLGEVGENIRPRSRGAVERLSVQWRRPGPTGWLWGVSSTSCVVETAEHGGYPLLEHLRKIVEGPIVWAPGVNGAVVLSLRGGDFVFESGQDVSIGYDSHDSEVVRLYLQESFSFHVATPEAAVALKS